MTIEKEILDRAEQWLGEGYDTDTIANVSKLIESDQEELYECFYKDLEFGTGGMRGLMGVGTNRINVYTISMATQGLANYLKNSFDSDISVAIAHDSRNNSPLFAKKAADVLSSNGIKVYLFDALRPTPELSFAIRKLGCKSGIVITASHNPKEYNGYKVYWEDGAQVVPPHDKGIINEVRSIQDISEVNSNSNGDLIQYIGSDIDELYLEDMLKLNLDKEAIQNSGDIGIVYTGLHGTGITLIPEVLKRAGFSNVTIVPKQDVPDGNFPTVDSPNPEEKEALQMGLNLAKEVGGEIVLGTDPDADRVGMAVRNQKGEYELINGNQACVLLVWYHLKKWKEQGRLDGNQFIAKTIVTTELVDEITNKFDVKLYNTLTGFKYIAAVIRELEGKEQFITGGEESFGYMVSDFVRDKDAVVSTLMFCEIASWAKSQGKTILDVLDEIYLEYGYFKEHLVSLKKMGSKGQEEIAKMMEGYRSNPPAIIAGSSVVRKIDVLEGKEYDVRNGSATDLDLPSSNVIQFYTEDGSKITARPSGTEPKIKFYISVQEDGSELNVLKTKAEEKIQNILSDLGL